MGGLVFYSLLVLFARQCSPGSLCTLLLKTAKVNSGRWLLRVAIRLIDNNAAFEIMTVLSSSALTGDAVSIIVARRSKAKVAAIKLTRTLRSLVTRLLSAHDYWGSA